MAASGGRQDSHIWWIGIRGAGHCPFRLGSTHMMSLTPATLSPVDLATGISVVMLVHLVAIFLLPHWLIKTWHARQWFYRVNAWIAYAVIVGGIVLSLAILARPNGWGVFPRLSWYGQFWDASVAAGVAPPMPATPPTAPPPASPPAVSSAQSTSGTQPSSPTSGPIIAPPAAPSTPSETQLLVFGWVLAFLVSVILLVVERVVVDKLDRPKALGRTLSAAWFVVLVILGPWLAGVLFAGSPAKNIEVALGGWPNTEQKFSTLLLNSQLGAISLVITVAGAYFAWIMLGLMRQVRDSDGARGLVARRLTIRPGWPLKSYPLRRVVVIGAKRSGKTNLIAWCLDCPEHPDRKPAGVAQTSTTKTLPISKRLNARLNGGVRQTEVSTTLVDTGGEMVGAQMEALRDARVDRLVFVLNARHFDPSVSTDPDHWTIRNLRRFVPGPGVNCQTGEMDFVQAHASGLLVAPDDSVKRAGSILVVLNKHDPDGTTVATCIALDCLTALAKDLARVFGEHPNVPVLAIRVNLLPGATNVVDGDADARCTDANWTIAEYMVRDFPK